MQDGFLKVAAASPLVAVADCPHNARQIIATAKQASERDIKLLVTPELGVTGYTCGDLFLQDALLAAAEAAVVQICRETAALPMVLVVGVPVRHRGKLYNCAAVICGGHLLGLVPKSYPPNYAEFYELRHFSPAFAGVERCEQGLLRGTPIGMQLLFRCENMPSFVLCAEICEDLWVPAPPSVFHVAAGATVVANLSASSETVGKATWRQSLLKAHSGRLVCGYIYADAGSGESSTDLVFAGHNMVAENGAILAESTPFSGDMAISELDLDALWHERQRITTFPDGGRESHATIPFSLVPQATALTREISPTPFVPSQGEELLARCESILSIQAHGLAKRLGHVGAKRVVIGVSGGLDSSLALLVAHRAFQLLGWPAANILAITMPGFGTTGRTRSNAEALCKALGVSLQTIDIAATTRSHFADISHDESEHSTVYENAQARLRTMVLMDIANAKNALVVGTGDLSELALGWATYNGDHMSMYAVNASVPKTLVRHLVAHVAQATPALKAVLQDILDTPVSPELLPPENGDISQQTEQIVGPYELHDFFLYYVLRWGFSPAKIARLAAQAFKDSYQQKEILEWMQVFYRRFFQQQYKRSCLPDGPKVGSVALSPRGDWRMPSDAVADIWLNEVSALLAKEN